MKPSVLQSGVLRAIHVTILWVGIYASVSVHAQDAEQDTVEVEMPVNLPTVQSLASALSEEQQRDETLLTVASVAALQQALRTGMSGSPDELIETLVSDREWLASLQSRFGRENARSPVMDPAVWMVQLQLDKHNLRGSYLASTLGPGLDVNLKQVMDRKNIRLAASVLPELMWNLEANSTLIWSEFLETISNNSELARAGMATGLFDNWGDQGPEADIGESETEVGDEKPSAESTQETGSEVSADGLPETLIESKQQLEALLYEAAGMGPPDYRRLASLRQNLLAELPRLQYADRIYAANLLHISGLVEGLYRERYFHFTEGLLAVLTQMEQDAIIFPDRVQGMAQWLGEVLPQISNTFARSFSSVDPKLNSTIAAAYDVVRSLGQPPTIQGGIRIRQELGDAVASLSLMIPFMGFYFDVPVRDPIAGGVDACTGLVARSEADGSSSLTRELFDDCLETLTILADEEARLPQHSGDSNGPFGEIQLSRELELTSSQRINYGLGYLHDRYSTGCELPLQPLPNPLEWAYLATYFSWLAEQAPVYFRTPENEQRLLRIRAVGGALMSTISEQVDCIAGAGSTVNDPVYRVTTDYQVSLRELGSGLQTAEQEFRQQFLAENADIRLDLGPEQSTAYRPDNLEIGPCDPENICEMSGNLTSTRALLGLFPDPYLTADQSGLGDVEICYDNLEWVDRRLEPVRPGDENVANYHGRLAFDLKGRYNLGEDSTDLFGFRFTTPDEHHYMFAALSDEILADSCPVEWIGNRIVTELPDKRGGIVPNRLTYLSASRVLPSRLLSRNWDSGAEWRDRFVTGIGVEVLSMEIPEDIKPALARHLDNLYRLEQDSIYSSLLESSSGFLETPLSFIDDGLNTLDTSKALVRMQVMLFYPHIPTESDLVRTAIAGQDGLLDSRILERFRAENIPVSDIVQMGNDRLGSFQENWRNIPEAVRRSGSIADFVSHTMIRLNALYTQVFIAPPVLEEIEATGLIRPPLSGSEPQAEQVGTAQEELDEGGNPL